MWWQAGADGEESSGSQLEQALTSKTNSIRISSSPRMGVALAFIPSTLGPAHKGTHGMWVWSVGVVMTH